jgi:anti-sigma factor RsiW
MSCALLLRDLSDYIDGTLAPDRRSVLEEHLSSCDKCHLVLDTTQCTILLYRAAESPSLDATRREALLRRLEKACLRGPDPV